MVATSMKQVRLDCSCKPAQTYASCAVIGRGSTTPPGVQLGVPAKTFFVMLTWLTEKERARCLSMSIGVINMACPR